LIVSFNTQELRDCCASLERAEAVIGSAHAQELISVLSDAEAAETAEEFIELYAPHVARDGASISLPIGIQYRLTFVAIGANVARSEGACLDWRAVRRVKVMDLSPC
jgi:hypothetical protein